MMSFLSCENSRSCTAAAIITSLIIGIVTAFLQITDALTLTPVFLWVAFGIAVGALAITLATAHSAPGTISCRGCCPPLIALLIGALGTILTALILLGIPAALGGVIGAILVGILLFFFFLTLTATACYVRCLANCNN